MVYLWAFLIGLGFDLVPIIWAAGVDGTGVLVINSTRNPWLVLAAGVPDPCSGVILLSLYTPWLTKK
jgi:hypothetical protein